MAYTHHSAKPKGSITVLHGLSTYMTPTLSDRPVNGIIIVISDIFGWVFSETRALANAYAEKGNFLVYVPDFTKGKYY